MSSRIRVVVAKPGLDGHDRGAKVVARALRDAGMEVVYTGLHQTPEQIVETAIQEDADAVGLSVLSGAHMTLFRRVLELLGERDARDIVVFGGGIIPNGDIPELEKMGVAKIFTPGATTQAIVEWVRQNVGPARRLRPRAPGVSTGSGHGGGAGRTPHTSGPSMHDAPPPPLDRQGIGRLPSSRCSALRHLTQRRPHGRVTHAGQHRPDG